MSDDARERSARDSSTPPDRTDGNQMMIQPDQHLDAEVVSAWLDTPEEFNEQTRNAIETHLADCAECRQIAAELTAIVRAFQTLPLVEPPHSFGLSEEAAGLTATPTLPASRQLEAPAAPRPRTPASRATYVEATPWYARQMRTLRWATAVATMLFVFLLSADLISNVDMGGGDDDDSDTMIAMDAPQYSSEAAPESTPASAAAQAEDSERSSDEAEATVAADDESAAGGSADASTLTDVEQESAESDDGDDAAPANTETMMTEEPPTTGEADLAQEDDATIAAYNARDTAAESQESNTLHLIELALAITIAWLIVAMIALPRLRQPRM